MQFKHPELLWALLLLLIPIFIHLFQLRRFKKTPFTNVAMLQKVVAESRKSNTLKKWLLLTTRLLLFASLILAFAQPFFAKESALKEKETVIYLDDSFSMQAKTEGSTLLEKAVQDLIKAIPSTGKISLFTNQKTFKDVELRAIQNNLLQLQTGSKQLKYNDIVLKGSTLFSNKKGIQKNLILVSDFQDQLFENQIDSIKDIQLYLAKMNPDTFSNIALDTVYFGAQKNDQLELIAEVSGVQNDQTLPISLYNSNTLIAKTAVEPSNNGKSKVVFSLQKDQPIQGRIQIDDNGLSYDNQFFFNIEKKEKIKVLAVNEESDNYLKRLFQNEEFDFLSFSPNDLNYSKLTTQNLIILNGLKAIPTSLQNILIEYYKEGGHLVIIPALKPNLNSYNSFLSPLRGITISNGQQTTQTITKISFDHPLYKNVFEKQVTNFDYPQIEKSFRANFRGTKALSYSNDEPFLIASNNLYLFTGSLDVTNSSFINSPLVVPTFYNMAQNSLKRSELYLTLKTNASVDVSTDLDKDNIIKMASARENFVPLQQNFNNRVRLSFLENPASDGIYAALNGTDTLQHVAFNYLRDESVLNYEKVSQLSSINQQKGIENLFEQLEQDNSITDYWKWFVIFALLFALMEVLIQKFLS